MAIRPSTALFLGFLCALPLQIVPANIHATSISERALQNELIAAQRAYDAASFDEAVALYYDILDTLDAYPGDNHDLRIDIATRLGQSLYDAGKYEELLNTYPVGRESSLHHQRLYALSLKEQSKYVSAADALRTLLRKDESASTRFELAHTLFLAGERDESATLFEAITVEDPLLYEKSQLFIVRLELEPQHPQAALTRLDALNEAIAESSNTRYERNYLRGQCHLDLGNNSEAIFYFEKALPPQNPEKVSWWKPTLLQLATSYLRRATETSLAAQERQRHFRRSREILEELQEKSPCDQVQIALTEVLITEAKHLNSAEAMAEAKALLGHEEYFVTPYAKTQALLLKADAADNFSERESCYRRLTAAEQRTSPLYGRNLYLRGMNDLQEGLDIQKLGDHTSAHPHFQSAAQSFQTAVTVSESVDLQLALDAASALMQTYSALGTERALEQGIQFMDSLEREHPLLHETKYDPGELIYEQARLMAQHDKYIYQANLEDPIRDLVMRLVAVNSSGPYTDRALYILATRDYKIGLLCRAEQMFQHIYSEYPDRQHAGDALFWLARCKEQSDAPKEEIRELFKQVYDKYPNSTYATEAYFHSYSLAEYLQGDEAAIEHLEALDKKFPKSSYVANAKLLIGLDLKRSRHSPSGHLIRQKDWDSAIAAFQQCEEAFERLLEEGNATEDLASVYLRARLERAMANLAIANASQGAKRDIYIEYAIDLFRGLLETLDNPSSPLWGLNIQGEAYPAIAEETSYGLAIAHLKAGQNDEALQVLDKMTERFHRAKVTRGYYLSRVRYQQAYIAMRKDNYRTALKYLNAAEDANKGKVLSTDEHLDLWIQRSHCYRELGRLDEAMRQLSQVINSDAVSTLRLKAMYLRADIYELQQRPELAQKQLEAVAKMGGYWATQAQERLKRDYTI